MDDNSNAELVNLKIRIKQWEKQFVADQTRKPGKLDIENAGGNIKGLYNRYYKIKKLASSNGNCKYQEKEEAVWSLSSQIRTPKPEEPTHENKLYSKLSTNLKSHSSLRKRLKPKSSNEILTSNESTEEKLQDVNVSETCRYKIKDKTKDLNLKFKDISDVVSLPIAKRSKPRVINQAWLSRCEESIEQDVDSSIGKSENVADAKVSPIKTVSKVEDECQAVFKVAGNNDGCGNDENVAVEVVSRKRKRSSDDCVESNVSKAKVDVNNSKMERLEKKFAAGSQNENFVRVNLKRKRFSRGHTKMSYSNYKFNKWKNLKSNRRYGSSENGQSASVCFKCKELGHYSKFCPKNNDAPGKLDENVSDDDLTLPTLEEAAEIAQGFKTSRTVSQIFNTTGGKEDVPNEVKFDQVISEKSLVQPFYVNEEGHDIPEAPKLVRQTLQKFGYEDFRNGQEAAVMRILYGMSTLVVLSTGSGKSLCYQLPAYLYAKEYGYITLVISPLVSLMEDQVTGLPACVNGACCHSNQTPTQRKKVLESISDGKCHVLFVSPEAIVGGNGNSPFLPEKLPPIAFVCIDEVHCLSEWSHNFRPSYLRLCKVLMEKYGVKCFLGLTATATLNTIRSITHHLEIRQTNALIKGAAIPSNLFLSVSRDYNKDDALMNLLKGGRFADCHSIIVYCTRRDSTERLSTLIRMTMNQPSIAPNGKKRLSSVAEAYHAGLTPSRRKIVQNSFMSGELKVVVATVAFGMGLDKCDVRAVIHYNMPKNFESYVQEIGRAGRDGKPAQCHVFLDAEENDMNELKRHIHSNSLDRHTVRKLVKDIFQNDFSCKDGTKCEKHEVAIPVSRTVLGLDVKEETIATLLCYLELHPNNWIKVTNHVYAQCEIKFYSGLKCLVDAAKKSAPLAAAIAMQKKSGNFDEKSKSLVFPVVEVSSKMGWNSSLVKRELKSLEWNNQFIKSGGKARRTGLVVELSELAFRMYSRCDLTDDDLDEILDYLFNRLKMQEKSELYQLNEIFNAFQSVCHATYSACCEAPNVNKSDKLKAKLCGYFTENCSDHEGNINKLIFGQELTMNEADCVENDMREDVIDGVRNTIRDFICIHTDHNFSGRSVAKIFYGIESPCYPSKTWSRVRRFWRSHMHVDFNFLVQLANQELIKLR